MDETYEESARRLERDHHYAPSQVNVARFEVPAEEVLVHNQVYPVARRHGTRGSRWWTQARMAGWRSARATGHRSTASITGWLGCRCAAGCRCGAGAT